MAEQEEKIMNIPLREVRNNPTTKRATIAMREIREYVSRHMKVPQEDVWIDSTTNEAVWKRGREKPPAMLRVKIIKFEDGIVEVSIPGE